jgi:predicted O-methyltransferase YrrM
MSVTLTKARRILQREGVSALLAGVFLHATNLLKAVWFLRRKPRFTSTAALLNAPQAACSGVISAYQVRSEISRLIDLLRQRAPQTIVEIGTANGGTLFLFTRVAAPDALIISVDLPGGQFGDGYPRWRVPLYRLFPIDSQRLHLVRANSHDPETLNNIKRILDGRPVDFLFIDGDHTYEGVRRDFEMYGPLVRAGGIVAFHDIAAHTRSTGCEVDRYWHEIRQRYPYQEFVDSPDQGWAGIGVIEIE